MCDWQKHSRRTLIEENYVIRDFEVGLSLDLLIIGQHLTSLVDEIGILTSLDDKIGILTSLDDEIGFPWYPSCIPSFPLLPSFGIRI